MSADPNALLKFKETNLKERVRDAPAFPVGPPTPPSSRARVFSRRQILCVRRAAPIARRAPPERPAARPPHPRASPSARLFHPPRAVPPDDSPPRSDGRSAVGSVSRRDRAGREGGGVPPSPASVVRGARQRHRHRVEHPPGRRHRARRPRHRRGSDPIRRRRRRGVDGDATRFSEDSSRPPRAPRANARAMATMRTARVPTRTTRTRTARARRRRPRRRREASGGGAARAPAGVKATLAAVLDAVDRANAACASSGAGDAALREDLEKARARAATLEAGSAEDGRELERLRETTAKQREKRRARETPRGYRRGGGAPPSVAPDGAKRRARDRGASTDGDRRGRRRGRGGGCGARREGEERRRGPDDPRRRETAGGGGDAGGATPANGAADPAEIVRLEGEIHELKGRLQHATKQLDANAREHASLAGDVRALRDELADETRVTRSRPYESLRQQLASAHEDGARFRQAMSQLQRENESARAEARAASRGGGESDGGAASRATRRGARGRRGGAARAALDDRDEAQFRLNDSQETMSRRRLNEERAAALEKARAENGSFERKPPRRGNARRIWTPPSRRRGGGEIAAETARAEARRRGRRWRTRAAARARRVRRRRLATRSPRRNVGERGGGEGEGGARNARAEKNAESEAFMEEVEAIGSAYEEATTENQRLMQRLTERDGAESKALSDKAHAQQLRGDSRTIRRVSKRPWRTNEGRRRRRRTARSRSRRRRTNRLGSSRARGRSGGGTLGEDGRADKNAATDAGDVQGTPRGVRVGGETHRRAQRAGARGRLEGGDGGAQGATVRGTSRGAAPPMRETRQTRRIRRRVPGGDRRVQIHADVFGVQRQAQGGHHHALFPHVLRGLHQHETGKSRSQVFCKVGARRRADAASARRRSRFSSRRDERGREEKRERGIRITRARRVGDKGVRSGRHTSRNALREGFSNAGATPSTSVVVAAASRRIVAASSTVHPRARDVSIISRSSASAFSGETRSDSTSRRSAGVRLERVFGLRLRRFDRRRAPEARPHRFMRVRAFQERRRAAVRVHQHPWWERLPRAENIAHVAVRANAVHGDGSTEFAARARAPRSIASGWRNRLASIFGGASIGTATRSSPISPTIAKGREASSSFEVDRANVRVTRVDEVMMAPTTVQTERRARLWSAGREARGGQDLRAPRELPRPNPEVPWT